MTSTNRDADGFSSYSKVIWGSSTAIPAAPPDRSRTPDGQVEAGEAVGVCEDVDGDDPAASDREREDGERPAVGTPDDAARRAVDERPCGARREPPEQHRVRRHVSRAADQLDHARARDAAVSAKDDVRIEHGDQPLEVAVAG